MRKNIFILLFVVGLLLCSCGQAQPDSEHPTNNEHFSADTPPLESTVVLPESLENYIGKNVEAVLSNFQEIGFTTVDLVAVNDLTSENAELDGSVFSITIDGLDSLSAKEVVSRDAPVLIRYHKLTKIHFPLDLTLSSNLPYTEVAKSLYEAGFVNIITNEIYDQPTNSSKTVVTCTNFPNIQKNNSIPFDEEITITGHYPKDTYAVSVSINFHANWILSRYDVNFVFADNEPVVLPHGKSQTFKYNLPIGTYSLKFIHNDNNSIVSTATLAISGEATVNIDIRCHSDNIEVSTPEVKNTNNIAANTVILPYSSDYYLRKDQEVCVRALKELGFTNVSARPTTNTLWGKTQANQIVAVQIAGKKTFSHNDIFDNTAPVVVEYHIPDVHFSENAISVIEGDSFNLALTVSDQDDPHGITIEIDDPTILQKVSDHDFLALKEGNAYISAKYKNVSLAECLVTVNKRIIPISSITFDTSELTVSVGARFRPAYTYAPENANDTEVDFSFSTSFIELLPDGSLYASAAGTTEIKLSKNGTDLAFLTVHTVEVPVEDISFTEENISVPMNRMIKIPFSLSPVDATGISLEFIIKDPNIATISFDPKENMEISISGVSVGKTDLIIKSKETILLEQPLTVTEVLPSVIVISGVSETPYVGESGTFTPLFDPMDTTSQNVKWSSSAPKIIKVDKSGTYEALAPGKATITATHPSGVQGMLEVEVLPVPIESIELSSNWDFSKDFKKGDKMTIVADILPRNATNQKLYWSSSDTSVVKVSDKGVVTAVFAGKATITATSNDGISSSFNIEVAVSPQKFKVTYTLVKKSTNHVGNSWKKGFEFNGEALKSGKTVSIMPDEQFTICGWAEEKDSRPDYGSHFERLTLTPEMCAKGFTIESDFYVTENSGRYSGNSARWHLKVTFKPIK